ncbi:MAG: hypothetical protein E7644_08610 [Ruminococcaceae bacterium]|nr:hypothetical protein [Oscillospiraceae bacterium]
MQSKLATKRSGVGKLPEGLSHTFAYNLPPAGEGSRSPQGNIRLPAHFFFDTAGAKKKLAKRNALFVGAAHTRKLLKKFDQNFQTRACANIQTTPNFSPPCARSFF